MRERETAELASTMPLAGALANLPLKEVAHVDWLLALGELLSSLGEQGQDLPPFNCWRVQG